MKKLHKIAVCLCEGQAVWFNGHLLRAVDYNGNDNVCWECTMDCLCDIKMSNLCEECNNYHHHPHYLVLMDGGANNTKNHHIF